MSMESELFSPGAGVMSLFCVSVKGEVTYFNVSVLGGWSREVMLTSYGGEDNEVRAH